MPTAAQALGDLRHQRGVEPLASALSSLHKGWSVERTEIAKALGGIADEKAVEPLRQNIDRAEDSKEIRDPPGTCKYRNSYRCGRVEESYSNASQ